MPCAKSKIDSGGRPSSARTVSMILPASASENPCRRRKSVRSSSVLATIRPRAASMPLTKILGEDFAKFSSAGAASCAKRLAAYLLWRMVVSSKSFTPHLLLLRQAAPIEARDAERLAANLGIPAIKPAEIEIGRAVRQAASFDRIQVVDQDQEDVAVGGIERGRILGDQSPRRAREPLSQLFTRHGNRSAPLLWGRCGDLPARRGRPRPKARTQGKAFPTFWPQISNRNDAAAGGHWLEILTKGVISHI